ncbi:MAG: hypothetical protein AAFT19_09680 [Pseudomonadota bacterium]
MAEPESTAALWLAVVASGMFHGVNPGMGWPLAVSAALMERRAGALWSALLALAAGHAVAMLAVLLPFALLTAIVAWQQELQVLAGVLVLGIGIWLFVTKRHPRFLTRVPPSQLALWSFLIAVAHGAALMLVPIYLGLCAIGEGDTGHLAADTLMRDGVLMALIVAAAHSLGMTATGGALAFSVHRWLGLRFLTRGWFDLERVWAGSLVLVGALALFFAV